MKCLVLRETEYKEADKMLTVISDEAGKISVLAKGAKKSGSRFLAAASAFAYSDMELKENKGLYILQNAAIIESFYELRNDIDVLTAAAEIAKKALRVSQENLPDEEVLRYTLVALYRLKQNEISPMLIKAVYNFKLMFVLGMLAPEGINCTKKGTAQAIQYIYEAGENNLLSFKVSDEVENELYTLSERLFEQIVL